MQTTNKSSRPGIPRAKRRGALRSDRILLNEIAHQVRTARIASNLTQSNLAGLSNTGVRFVIDLEHGKPTIEFGKVTDVLYTLGLTLRVERIQQTSQP